MAFNDATLQRYKRPVEEFRLAWDFTNDLETSDTVASQAVTAIDLTDNADVTSTLLQSATLVGAVVSVQVQAGTSGRDYQVTFKATTTAADVFSRVVLVRVLA